MTLYGYRKFTEEHYWPIQVNKNSVRTMNAEDGTVQTQTNFYKLVNIGATKSVQRNASNGLFIKGALRYLYKAHNRNERIFSVCRAHYRCNEVV